jgi:DNA methylase
MKEIAGGKQMKSVWQILPPDKSEKRHGKHPTQKPVAILERILQAASDEGDLVLDPFLGGGTTLIAALSLRRHAFGCELSAEFIALSLRRLCSDLAHVELSVSSLQISVDPFPGSMDRSLRAPTRPMDSSFSGKLVRRDRSFYFIGTHRREVIYSVSAENMEEALRKFQSSPHSSIEILFIIKTETEIYLA